MPGPATTPLAIPSFDAAPPIILVVGDVDFFVEEAADEIREKLAGEGAEALRFDDDASAETVSEALLNRSLFSPRRVVQLDVSRLLGTDSPGPLLTRAIAGWERGGSAGRREAYRATRALLGALGVPPGPPPEERAEAVTKRLRRPAETEILAEILRELPEERQASTAVAPILRRLLEAANDGVVALLTATNPPGGAGLVADVKRKGLLVDVGVGKSAPAALDRLARARAKERDVTIDAEAIRILLSRTDEEPALFAAELEKLLQWAGPGGRIGAKEVGENVEDEASEDIFELYDAIGRRDAGQALRQIERIFSGHTLYAGDKPIEADESQLPQVVLGRVTDELRRMLLVRARLEAEDLDKSDATRNMGTFRSRVHPRLAAPVEPFGRSPFGGSPFLWFYVAQRASRYTTRELARALARAPEVDVKLKNSAPPLETLTEYVAGVIAGTG